MNLKQQLCYSGSVFAGLYLFWYLFYPHLYLFNQFCAISILLIISWTLGFCLYDRYNTETVTPTNRAVLITGCDTGFGHNLAQRLDKFGFHVHAGVLFPEGDGAKELKQKCSKRLRIHKMDVTSPEDVPKVVEEIKQTKMELWAVVNNAGIGYAVPCDWGNDVDIFKKTFEVNVLGVVRVTKYCLPLIRKSNGRIVNVASVAGRLTAPALSHYAMSKHSVRTFSNTLRLENFNHKFKVVTIEPTFYRTPIIDFEQINRTRNRIFDETPEDNKQNYSRNYFKHLENIEEIVTLVARTNVDEVTDAMMKGVTLKEPKLFYRCCGYLDILVLWATALLPECLGDVASYLISINKFSTGIVKTYLRLIQKLDETYNNYNKVK